MQALELIPSNRSIFQVSSPHTQSHVEQEGKLEDFIPYLFLTCPR